MHHTASFKQEPYDAGHLKSFFKKHIFCYLMLQQTENTGFHWLSEKMLIHGHCLKYQIATALFHFYFPGQFTLKIQDNHFEKSSQPGRRENTKSTSGNQVHVGSYSAADKMARHSNSWGKSTAVRSLQRSSYSKHQEHLRAWSSHPYWMTVQGLTWKMENHCSKFSQNTGKYL